MTPRLGLQASTAIPLIARTGIVHRTTGDTPFRDEVRGLGDTVVGAWYRGGSPSAMELDRQWCAVAPTGATRAPRFRPELNEGSLVPLSRLQRGSGTVDPTFGVSAERPLHGGRWVSSFAARVPVARECRRAARRRIVGAGDGLGALRQDASRDGLRPSGLAASSAGRVRRHARTRRWRHTGSISRRESPSWSVRGSTCRLM